MGITTRKRAYISNTSSAFFDAHSGICTIEYFQATKDPFRWAPGNEIPVPWPVEHSRCSSAARDFVTPQLMDRIKSILNDHQIPLQRHFLTGLGRKGMNCTQADTLILYTEDENWQCWNEAATKIFDQLIKPMEKMLGKFRLEIRNERKMYQDRTYVVPPNSPTHRSMMQIRQRIITVAQTICRNEWNSICYVMRGPALIDEDSTRIPTVILFVNPLTRNRWFYLEDRFIVTLASVKTEVNLTFEILPSFLLRSTELQSFEMLPDFLSSDTELQPQNIGLFNRHLPSPAINGASIGPRTNNNAGSLGIWAYFTPEGETTKQQCFLTCYHVVRLGDLGNLKHTDIKGIGLRKVKVKRPIQICYPATCDAEETREVLQKEIDSNDDREDAARQTLNVIDEYKSQGDIGRVMYASGDRVREGRAVDWAIVMLNHNVPFGKNVPPPFFSALQLGIFKYNVEPNETITTVGNFELDGWVAKVGRSTGVSTGDVNCMRSDFPNKRTGTTTSEVMLVAFPSGSIFVRPGDSGSMVINIKKEWVGMVFGSQNGEECAFATSAQDILDDIKETTGGTLSLP